mmetsp:Transcript_30790/g.79087  ORF Transcript_30790/g.79087 Transcript_30790/m.79087 type:complete len:338 (+) Transcript_30790:938-1951(+)
MVHRQPLSGGRQLQQHRLRAARRLGRRRGSAPPGSRVAGAGGRVDSAQRRSAAARQRLGRPHRASVDAAAKWWHAYGATQPGRRARSRRAHERRRKSSVVAHPPAGQRQRRCQGYIAPRPGTRRRAPFGATSHADRPYRRRHRTVVVGRRWSARQLLTRRHGPGVGSTRGRRRPCDGVDAGGALHLEPMDSAADPPPCLRAPIADGAAGPACWRGALHTVRVVHSGRLGAAVGAAAPHDIRRPRRGRPVAAGPARGARLCAVPRDRRPGVPGGEFVHAAIHRVHSAKLTMKSGHCHPAAGLTVYQFNCSRKLARVHLIDARIIHVYVEATIIDAVLK